ncbi:hypothetical protein F2P81_016278 [Scophthalmus maximus]|uniref:Uncharacterized protein n=1 Tax=Scophthalmus maximus TaxID=52904 RepID=A0A6A4SC31_SCOMX|nr:hypothetical protein F2P81_016278 [Scophthalmus maximus]
MRSVCRREEEEEEEDAISPTQSPHDAVAAAADSWIRAQQHHTGCALGRAVPCRAVRTHRRRLTLHT